MRLASGRRAGGKTQDVENRESESAIDASTDQAQALLQHEPTITTSAASIKIVQWFSS